VAIESDAGVPKLGNETILPGPGNPEECIT